MRFFGLKTRPKFGYFFLSLRNTRFSKSLSFCRHFMTSFSLHPCLYFWVTLENVYKHVIIAQTTITYQYFNCLEMVYICWWLCRVFLKKITKYVQSEWPCNRPTVCLPVSIHLHKLPCTHYHFVISFRINFSYWIATRSRMYIFNTPYRSFFH